MSESTFIWRIYWYGFLLAVATVLIPATAQRAQGPRIKLAVIGLDNPATLPKSNIGNSLVAILDSDISAAGKYTLLEREELEHIKQELNLGGSELANVKNFAQKGGLVGADFLLNGTVSDYTYNEHRSVSSQFVPNVGWQQVVAYEHVANVRVDIRLVDVRTGEVVRSFSGHGTANNTGSASFLSVWNMYIAGQGEGTLSNLATLLTDASNSALQHAVRQLNDAYDDLASLRAKSAVSTEVSSVREGKILAGVGQGQFVIGVPSTANLKIGDRFNIIAEIPIKNSQGVVVYSQKRSVGALQITDISESTKAMARLVSAPGPEVSVVQPKEGDALVFDEQHGRSLRGIAAPGAGGTAVGNGTGGATISVQSYIDRGNRFMDSQEYSEALHQYREGLTVEPNNGTLLSGKALAELGIDDFMDAEDDAEKAIRAGGSVNIPAYHLHAFGNCEGTILIQRGKLSYEPTTGNDNFTATSKSQISILQKDFPAKEERVPDLWIQAPDQGGKVRKYEMIFPMFLPHPTPKMAINFQITADAANKTKRLDGLIVRLINASLQ
jgi:curli biogenesis system outer membrane secretion channel CsgG